MRELQKALWAAQEAASQSPSAAMLSKHEQVSSTSHRFIHPWSSPNIPYGRMYPFCPPYMAHLLYCFVFRWRLK